MGGRTALSTKGLAVAALAVAALAPVHARAASVDMATLACQDWIDDTEDEQDQMLAWLRGYLAGRATSSLYNPDSARFDRTALKIYCQKHLTTGVISAASQSLH